MKTSTILLSILAAVSIVASIGKAQALDVSQADRQCMIDNIFYEAASEPLEGQILVAQTVINRTVTRNRWGSTICETIYERAQFSWTFIPAYKLWRFKTNPKNAEAYARIEANIDFILSIPPVDSYKNVTHYLRCGHSSPEGWEKKFEFLGQVGNHCFYHEN